MPGPLRGTRHTHQHRAKAGRVIRFDATGPVAPVGPQGPPRCFASRHAQALREAARLSPMDYRDNLHRDQQKRSTDVLPKPANSVCYRQIRGDILEGLIVGDVDRLDLERLHEAFGPRFRGGKLLALSYGLPRRLIEPTKPWALRRARCGSEAYCEPRSEWWTHPGRGRRSATAALSAATTRRASIERLRA